MNDYPPDWPEIAKRIKDAAGWKCERCTHVHEVETGYVLTVHHLDGNKENCADWNLAALCQRCHLKIQGRVKMDQLFFLEVLDVSPWFKPHLEGYLASIRAQNQKPVGLALPPSASECPACARPEQTAATSPDVAQSPSDTAPSAPESGCSGT